MASVESVGEGQEALDALKMTEYDEDSMDEDAERIGEEEEDDDEGEDDSSEEEDKREYGIYQCLPVEGGEPNWEEEEPQTVEEYLRRVRCCCAAAAPPRARQGPHVQRLMPHTCGCSQVRGSSPARRGHSPDSAAQQPADGGRRAARPGPGRRG
jgi:hypothetical protein